MDGTENQIVTLTLLRKIKKALDQFKNIIISYDKKITKYYIISKLSFSFCQ